LQIEPLEWWKLNSIRFPILSIMAKAYLSIMATSAPIEREFSIFSNIITRSRNSLDEQTARMTILLKSWKVPEILVEEPEIIESGFNNSEAEKESDTEEI
jgi:hypothetical protein